MTPRDDPHALQRFIEAQDPVWARVLRELAAGRKTSHWMWFVFPQLRGLGHSPMATFYGLASLDEARAYHAHPTLGPRLHEALARLMAQPEDDAHRIFGSPDDLKLQASLTLFEAAAPGDPRFAAALARFHGGRRHAATLAALARAGG